MSEEVGASWDRGEGVHWRWLPRKTGGGRTRMSHWNCLFHQLPENLPPSAASALMHQCVFYDEDGDPICFSPDVLPSGTKLYLRIQPVSLGSGTSSATDSPQKWTWDPVINAYPEIAYILSDDNTTVTHKKVNSPGHSMPILCGTTTSFKTGQHQWRVLFTSANAYCAFGLVSQTERDQVREKEFGDSFNSYPLFQKFF